MHVHRLIPLTIPVLITVFLASPARADLRNFDDATLHGVAFVDAKEGWAVGDDGVILHTIDGGQSWDRQSTGTRASFRSVFFLNPFVGWVAGREELSEGRSVGVLMQTLDGGGKWARVAPNSLPGLNLVRFTDAKHGILLGDGQAPFVSGIFRTADGGRTWDPVPGPAATSWRCGDFQDAGNGLFGGTWSRLGAIRQNKVHVGDDQDRLAGRAIRGMSIVPKQALAVGDGGVILRTNTGGAGWSFVDAKLPADVAACLDFCSLATHGNHIWAVGRPGSVVLHSADAGATWQLQRTGQSLPLRGVSFVDKNTGWAVGDAGVILRTQDAGTTWSVQRQGAKRAAVLAVAARPEDIPLDVIAQLAGLDGYHTSALCITSSDAAAAATSSSLEDARVGAAVRRAGGLTAERLWAFPLPGYLAGCGRETILESWNARHGGDAGREVLRQLVLAIRMWRPSVLLADDPSEASPLRSLTAEAVQAAIKAAADPSAFPEQIEKIGLAAWKVERLFVPSTREKGAVRLDNTSVHVALGGAIQDFIAAPARWLGDAECPNERAYRWIDVGTGEAVAAAPAHWMQGVVIAENDGRRKLDPTPDDPEAYKALRQGRHLIAVGERMSRAEDPRRAMAQFAPSLDSLTTDQAGSVLRALASRFLRAGQWQLARETNLLLVDRFPTHEFAEDAYRWLIRYGSSAEARLRAERQNFAQPDRIGVQLEISRSDLKQKGDPIRQVRGESAGAPPAEAADKIEPFRAWNSGSLQLASRLSTLGPLYATDPVVQFCMQSSRRNLDGNYSSRDFLGRFREFVAAGPWHDAASSELWIHHRSGEMARPIVRCRRTEVRPLLDGHFDDACWRDLKSTSLDNAAGSTAKSAPTDVMMAYDQEFLYVAIRCARPAEWRKPIEKTRTRDADLDAEDRVSILLDIDRDYSTYYRLEVDQRGRVREDCWNDPSWNPKWYVAAAADDNCWRVEAAIPLSELTNKAVTLNQAWAINVARILPGRGVQAVSRPADVQPRPEGMTLLLFQQDANQAKSPPMQAP